MRMLTLAASALLLPVAAGAASRGYEVAAFDKVSVAAGVEVDISQGATRSVIADTSAADFDDLRITVKDGELRIDRPPSKWFRFWRQTNYTVRVVMPVLRSVEAFSGSNVEVKGAFAGDFTVSTSSGSRMEIAQLKGGKVRASSSSGSTLEVAGSCQSLDADTSSGSNINADGLTCESVTVEASSGSGARVAATKGLTASASSGANVRVSGAPTAVKINNSSGGRVHVTQVEK